MASFRMEELHELVEDFTRRPFKGSSFVKQRRKPKSKAARQGRGRPSGRESDPEQVSFAHTPQDEAPTIATRSASQYSEPSQRPCSTARKQGDADSPPDLQSRLRGLASSLPTLDALTSSASLSSAVSAASQRTRALASDMRSRLSTLAAQYNNLLWLCGDRVAQAANHTARIGPRLEAHACRPGQAGLPRFRAESKCISARDE